LDNYIILVVVCLLLFSFIYQTPAITDAERLAIMNVKPVTTVLFVLEGVGAIFVGIFLAVYLGGLFANPQTTVFHSVPEIKLTLAVLGVILLVITLATVILAILKRNEAL
jgi:hypothetical protein